MTELRIPPASDEKCLSAFTSDKKKNPKYLGPADGTPEPFRDTETVRVLF